MAGFSQRLAAGFSQRLAAGFSLESLLFLYLPLGIAA